MNEIYLALVLLTQLDTVPPRIVQRYDTVTNCTKASDEANARPEFNTKEARKQGLTTVCLRAVRDYI
jgi:hypothetical protein